MCVWLCFIRHCEPGHFLLSDSITCLASSIIIRHHSLVSAPGDITCVCVRDDERERDSCTVCPLEESCSHNGWKTALELIPV